MRCLSSVQVPQVRCGIDAPLKQPLRASGAQATVDNDEQPVGREERYRNREWHQEQLVRNDQRESCQQAERRDEREGGSQYFRSDIFHGA